MIKFIVYVFLACFVMCFLISCSNPRDNGEGIADIIKNIEVYSESSDEGVRTLALFLIAEMNADYDGVMNLLTKGSRMRYQKFFSMESTLPMLKYGSILLSPGGAIRVRKGEIVAIVRDSDQDLSYFRLGERGRVWRNEDGVHEIYSYAIYFNDKIEVVYLGVEDQRFRVLLPPMSATRLK